MSNWIKAFNELVRLNISNATELRVVCHEVGRGPWYVVCHNGQREIRISRHDSKEKAVTAMDALAKKAK